MSESQEPVVEPPVETPADRRVELDEQPLALAEAEAAGTLPEEDRRVHDAEHIDESTPESIDDAPAPPTEIPVGAIPVGEISHVRERADGVRVDAAGHILG